MKIKLMWLKIILVLKQYIKFDPKSESTDWLFYHCFDYHFECLSSKLINCRNAIYIIFAWVIKIVCVCWWAYLSLSKKLWLKFTACYYNHFHCNSKSLSYTSFTVDVTPSFVFFLLYVLIFQIGSRNFQYLTYQLGEFK